MKLKCTKFDFGWRSAPDPTGGAYIALPKPLAGFQGQISKEKREEEWGEDIGEKRKGEDSEEKLENWKEGNR